MASIGRRFTRSIAATATWPPAPSSSSAALRQVVTSHSGSMNVDTSSHRILNCAQPVLFTKSGLSRTLCIRRITLRWVCGGAASQASSNVFLSYSTRSGIGSSARRRDILCVEIFTYTSQYLWRSLCSFSYVSFKSDLYAVPTPGYEKQRS